MWSLWFACQPMEPSGQPLRPVVPDALPAVPASGDHFDFEADARKEAAEPVVAAPTLAPVPTPAPTATSDGWGARLLATVPEAVPPRAMLATPDGKEIVVEPGTLLPDLRWVILAVGHDTIEVAEIRPAGVYATVHTVTLHALAPRRAEAPVPATVAAP